MIAELLPNLGELIVRWLAVVGAAALGALAAGVVLQLLARVMTRRKVPPLPLNVIRLLGGVAAGLLIYLLIFGTGSGFGFGFGNGFGFGGKGTGTGSPGSTATVQTGPTRPPTSSNGPPVPAQPGILRVRMVGGELYKKYGGQERDAMDRNQDPFYWIAGEEKPQSWEQVRLRIERTKGLEELEIIIEPTDSVGKRHGAVLALEELAERYKLKVSYPPRKN